MNSLLFAQLRRVPLFSEVSDDDLKLILQKLESVYFSKGSIIIREGDLGDCFYIIRNGVVRVETHPEDVEQPIVLARLEAGDYFGEMALITGEPRSATVVAETDVQLWRLLKADFDQLILQNPHITLTLTHMLSHRLINTNKALQKTEVQFLKKMHPRGELKNFGLIRILNFAEQNALTGRIILKKGEKTAIFNFEKGQLVHLDYENKKEDEALDELLSWQDGTFVIEPKIFDFETQTLSQNPNWTTEETKIINAFERYFLEKFTALIQGVGSKNLQLALNKAWHKLLPVYDQLRNVKIELTPELKIDFSAFENFNEKYVLIFALLFAQITQNLSKEVLGMEFFDIHSDLPEINEILDQEQFFLIYQQAGDLF